MFKVYMLPELDPYLCNLLQIPLINKQNTLGLSYSCKNILQIIAKGCHIATKKTSKE